MSISNNFIIYNSLEKVDVKALKRLLSNSYWASDRSLEAIQKSLEHSECFSLYDKDKQIGFARVVTDYATVAYLADVIIEASYRGQGLGKWLVEKVVQDERWRDKFLLLATDDAHNLYKKQGFKQSPKLMGKG